MSSAIYERLINLYDAAGLSTESGSYAEAEAKACAAGAELLRDIIESKREAIFFLLSESEPSLKHYAAMLSVDSSALTGEALKELILARLSHGYGAVQEKTELESEMPFSQTPEFSVNGDIITVSNLHSGDIYNFGSVAKGITPCGKTLRLSYGGLKWNQWAQLAKTFRELEALSLTFDCFDTLGYELFN